MLFVDRLDAGRRLAARLQHLRTEPVVVLGLPRGGVSMTAYVDLLVTEAMARPNAHTP
jgi:predicted phosphoribosyltransferase